MSLSPPALSSIAILSIVCLSLSSRSSLFALDPRISFSHSLLCVLGSLSLCYLFSRFTLLYVSVFSSLSPLSLFSLNGLLFRFSSLYALWVGCVSYTLTLSLYLSLSLSLPSLRCSVFSPLYMCSLVLSFIILCSRLSLLPPLISRLASLFARLSPLLYDPLLRERGAISMKRRRREETGRERGREGIVKIMGVSVRRGVALSCLGTPQRLVQV